MQSESWWFTNKPLPKQAVIREGADWNQNIRFLMKYEGQGRVFHKFMQYMLNFGNVFNQRWWLCFRMRTLSPPLCCLKSSLENSSHLKMSIYLFLYICDSSSYCDVGKWFRMPRHSGSRRGRPGRECSCSCVQRRPGHETSWQGWPGSQALLSFFYLSIPLSTKHPRKVIHFMVLR